ncbi:RHS repeat-associated protein [Nonomuraea muscovyensis]|uniref:RHS repeat-associated protein n=1 Tax=Nonomuraea muscovyensis TaxID=1124761 RepID=A0A7X0EX08_9ACTN|nr:RHS repeat-associated core domain-containing protein [Nonomuraea muscovyensis]MBB6344345.1 RHS repeat-associated protein [Nonomuraea muscovyensis]
MDKSATKYVFDDQGRLRKVIDSRGRTQDLSYGTDGKLATVTATGRRSLHITWSGSRVAEASTDAIDGAPLKWTYTYEDDRLVGVCTPAPAPNCATYGYGTGSQYRSRVLDADPFAYWRLGENSGTVAADQTPAERHATYQSVTLNEPGALTGNPDTAAKFAAGSALKLPTNIIPHLGDQLSLELWFKTSASGVLAAAGAQQTNGAAHGPMLYVGTDGRLRGSLGTVNNPITSAGPVNDGTWHHAVLTVSGTDQALYLDGQRVGTLSGSVTAWRQLASVGNGVTDPAVSPAVPATKQAFPLQGAIDEVALYGQPLTETEIADHYAARAQTAHKLTEIKLPSGRVWAANTYDPTTDRHATHTDQHGGTWKIGPLGVEVESGEATVVVTDPANETLKYYYDAWRGYRPAGEVDQLNHTEWYNYDQAGFLQTVTNRNGIDTRVYHDERGNRIARWYCRARDECAVEFWSYYHNANDPFDPRNDRMVAHRDGRSASETDNTFATKWEYNSYGEQTKETSPATSDFPDGRSTGITYTDGSEPAIGGGTTPPGLVASKTDARGHAWTYRYTASGDLAEQTDPEGLVTKLDYDTLGRLVASTQVSDAHPDGVKTTFTYDGLSRPVTQTEPGVKNEITDVTHTKRTTLTYDADGNKRSEKISDLTGGDAERATVYTYDPLGRVETITDPEGGVVRQAWNNLGQLVHVTDPRSTVIENGYSKRGELTTRALKGWTGSPVNPQPAKDVVLEAFAYDPAGRLAAEVDSMSRKTTYTYWDDNRLSQKIADDAKLNGSTTPRDVVLESHEYDPAGNLITQITGGATPVTTVFDYDVASRLTATIFDPATLERVTAFVYDANGNVLKTTLTGAGTTRSEVTEYAYDKVNQVTRTTVENGDVDIVTTSTYDDRGLAVATTDPRGNATGADKDAFTSTMRYDALGRLIEATGPQVKVDKAGSSNDVRPSARFGYDAAGARTRLTDGRGNATWTTYNTLGLPETVVEPATTAHPNAADRTWTAAYDAAGNPTALIQPGGVRIDRTFDHLGRLTKETGGGGDAASAERTFGYDLASRQTTIGDLTVDYNDRTLPLAVKRGESAQTSYAYDGLGNPTQRTDAAGTATFTWDTAGRLETATDPVTTRKLTYGYDAASRLKSMNAAMGTTAADSQIFTYDDLDRVETHTLKNGTGAQLAKITYGWDKDDNLTTKTTAGTAAAGTNTYTYDHAGRLTSWQAPSGTTTAYEWDASGNRTKAGDKTYTYDERNRLTSGDGTDYTYTPRGTLATQTKNGTTTQLTFDAFDRLIADGDSLYSYDALDRVTTRTRGTTKHLFAYSGLGNDLAAITDTAGGVQAKYGRDPFGGLLGQQEGTNPALATLTDLHGDLVATFTGTALATSTAYDPFGTVTAQTGAKTNLGYQGEYTDPDTGKVNMHARWYQPGTGTFTSRDTATLTPNPSVQANRYTYANASPLIGIDPTGHYTDHLSRTGGPEYDLSRDHEEVAESYARAGILSGGGGGSGLCMGTACSRSDIGGGATADMCIACIGAGQAYWDFSEDGALEWYFENYVLRDNPLMNDEWAKRSGVMPNGMTAPPGFWEMSAEERAAVTDFISWTNFINPSITEEELLGIVRPASAGQIGGVSAGSKQSVYDKYKAIVKYRRDIEKAAQNHGISKYVLASVLMWESTHATEGLGIGVIASIAEEGWNASLGVGQLEAYKARWMLIKYYSHERDWSKAKLRDVADQLHNPIRAIHLTAAWMKHLKENIKVTDADTGVNRPITDEEAAYAYCGCSGVVFRNKDGSVNYPVPKYDNFRIWVQSGYRRLNSTSASNAIQRKKDLDAMWKPLTGDAWKFMR